MPSFNRYLSSNLIFVVFPRHRVCLFAVRMLAEQKRLAKERAKEQRQMVGEIFTSAID